MVDDDGLVQLVLVPQGIAQVVEGTAERGRMEMAACSTEFPSWPGVQCLGQLEIEPEIARVGVLCPLQ